MTKPDVSIPAGNPPAELLMEDITVGEGKTAQAGNIVEVHYVGVAWSTNRQFDASWDRGETFDFRLGAGQVIQGWDDGVAGMKVGGRRQAHIPFEQAWGAEGQQQIGLPENTDIIVVIDLLAAF